MSLAIQKIPQKLAEILGRDGTDQFIDFTNSNFEIMKEELLKASEDKFARKLSEEISTVRLEIADLRTEVRTEIAEVRTEIAEVRTEIAELRAEVRNEIAELRAEVKTEIAELKAEVRTAIAGIRTELKDSIANQTKWLFGALVAVMGIIPLVYKLADKLIR